LSAIRQARQGRPSDAALTVLAWDKDNNRALAQGSLRAIDNRIEEGSGTIGLKAVFPNQPETLWPGQFVVVKLQTGRADAGLVIPEGAVQSGPTGPFVYVVDAQGRARVRAVGVERVSEGLALIARGLAQGEEVVTDGQYLLEQGSPVQRK
jgi:multidrug efflux system membrane fusion protein